ncbi:hypothetical protein M5D96_006874, partial [Drosophila gunungcola]
AREQDFIVECVKFDVDVTAKDLYDICTRIPNLSNLEVEGTKIHGILADIGRHCKDLQVLAVHLSPEGGAAQYSSLLSGIEKLAGLNNLQDLDISGKGNLTALFTKLAEKNILQRFRYSEELVPEEVIRVSQIKSLKKLECSFSDWEDYQSLTELASS